MKKKTHEEFVRELNIKNPNIHIIGYYQNSQTPIECECLIDGYRWSIKPCNILKTATCRMCSNRLSGIRKRKDINKFKEEISEILPNIIVLGKYVNNNTPIETMCKIDGHIWNPYPCNLLKGAGCPVCSNRDTIKGVNDIATIAPYLLEYLANKEDGFKYNVGSSKEVAVKCPHCSYEKKLKIYTLYKYGFRCPNCSDGISYPNKFLYSLLSQLNISFEREKIFDWFPLKRYDIYIPSLDCIIEIMGLQHYTTSTTNFKIKLCEIQENDKSKQERAIKNGIKRYIILDCRYSNKNFMQKSIIESEMQQIFNLSEVNFEECHLFALSSLKIKILELYNSGIKETKELHRLTKLSRPYITSILNDFYNDGLCDYQGILNYNNHNKKTVVCTTTNQTFDSLKSCAKYFQGELSLSYATKQIRDVCNGKNESYNDKKFVFR